MSDEDEIDDFVLLLRLLFIEGLLFNEESSDNANVCFHGLNMAWIFLVDDAEDEEDDDDDDEIVEDDREACVVEEDVEIDDSFL